jgi:hypothetical protein
MLSGTRKRSWLRVGVALALAWCTVHGVGQVRAAAETVREIEWPDLVPGLPATHPFARLTRYQAIQVKQVAELRDRIAAGEKLSALEREDLDLATRRLKKAGVDVDGLLAGRKEIAEQNRLAAASVNRKLDGQLIRMPGYLLPLEFSGKEITEFLLVPWAGACIHTPPPPPNQIVHVKALRPIGNVGLFDPVVVTGRLSASGRKANLYLVDGAADIDAAYSLSATAVEPYRP